MKTIVTIDPDSVLYGLWMDGGFRQPDPDMLFLCGRKDDLRVHHPGGYSALPELLDMLISLRSFDRMESDFGCVRFVYKDGSRTTLAAMSVPTIMTGIYMGIVANIAIDTAESTATDEPAGEETGP